jgi:hypothetical protein
VRATTRVPHDGEPFDGQRVRQLGHVLGHASGRAPGVSRRAAVARAVEAEPPDAEPGRLGEQRRGWRADVGRAVMPDDDESRAGEVRAGVVDVQCPAVAQGQVAFDHGKDRSQRGATGRRHPAARTANTIKRYAGSRGRVGP